MRILKSKNLIVSKDSVRIVPISNSLNDIDTVKNIVLDVLKDEKLEGRILSIEGYLINNTQKHCLINDKVINNIRCPFREYYRTIK